MWAQVMGFVHDPLNQVRMSLVGQKGSGQEEGSFGFALSQLVQNGRSAFCEFVPGEQQGDLLPLLRAANDAALEPFTTFDWARGIGESARCGAKQNA